MATYLRKHPQIKDDKGNHIRIGTRQYNILKFIGLHEETGVRYSDIQRFILGVDDNAPLKSSRGHYSTWLQYRMPRWCTKNEDGRWVLTDSILRNHFSELLSVGIINSIIDRLLDGTFEDPRILALWKTKLYGTV